MAMSKMPLFRLELRGIREAFPAVVANDGVDLAVAPGSIHAVLGENGAGKSTMMKIVYGVVRADAGIILWNGAPAGIASPSDARTLGIGMVFQHIRVVPRAQRCREHCTHVEGGKRPVDACDSGAGGFRALWYPHRSPRDCAHASVGERQRVEVVRNLLQEPKLLIMDEPTSVLTPLAARELFRMLRQLARRGRAFSTSPTSSTK